MAERAGVSELKVCYTEKTKGRAGVTRTALRPSGNRSQRLLSGSPRAENARYRVMVSACPSSFTPAFTSSIPFSAVPPKRERFAMTPLGALQALGASCTRAEILTFTALELHADRETGFCNPGRETLAEITGLPENRITKATTSLEKKGFIRKEQPDPFHVHYFVLPPPEPKPVEPRARFRPPLKASPAPEPAAQPVPPAGPNPCRQRHQLVPPTAHLTEQGIDQKEKESAGLAAAPPEQEPAPPHNSPPLAGLHKPMQEPELTPEQEQRQRQIADLAAQGLTLADAKAARNPVRPPAAPIPARRYTPEQQRQFIRLAQQGLSPQQIRERMRLD